MTASSLSAGTTRERPILFSGPMVRAILDGSKTQTRRVAMHKRRPFLSVAFDLPWIWAKLKGDADPHIQHSVHCPYGQPGDRLWVRESACIAPAGFDPHATTDVRDAEGRKRIVQYVATHPDTSYAADYGVKVTPSIHMPRWASRLTLEITGVRVERVRDITYPDAVAEGMTSATQRSVGFSEHGNALAAYSWLWDSLNAARGYGWDANPWVWVIEFRALSALTPSQETKP